MTTKSNNSEIAVLQTQMEEVLKGIDEIKDDMKTYLNTFATKQSVETLEKKIKGVERKKTLQTWITGTLSAVLGSVLTILVKSYFDHF